MIDGLYMPGLSEAWTGDLHCQAAANIGPNTWGGIKLRLCQSGPSALGLERSGSLNVT